jgi:hypothetical protein
MLAEIGDRRYEGYVAAGRAAIEAADGRLECAEEPLAFAESVFGHGADRFAPAVALARGIFEEVRARSAAPGKARPAIQVWSPATVSVRLVQMAVHPRLGGAPAAAGPPRRLWVGPDGTWFQVSDRSRVDLARRGAHRRVLARLLVQRLAAPGSALAWTILCESGWPGARLPAEAAFGRVRTLIYELRKLGLEGIIRTRDDGYLLEPSLAAGWAAQTGT